MTKNNPQQISLIPGLGTLMPALQLPDSELPLNRLRESGAYNLAAGEILSVILGQKDHTLAHLLLDRFQTLNALADADIDQLAQLPGIGPATAARLNAALELGRRLLVESAPERSQIRCPRDAYLIFRPIIPDNSREHFIVLTLDTRHRVIHKEILYTGTLNTSIVRTAEVFHYPVANRCAAIVVAHNHPSGDPNPSPEDIALTRRLVDAGKLLEIELLDHIILGDGALYVSLHERNLGFESV